MITAQSRAIDADPDAPMLPLAMDAAVVRFRKLVAETIAAESGDPAAPAAAQPLARDAREARSIA
jgi:vanillate O-demethylase monooxygenase subunit